MGVEITRDGRVIAGLGVEDANNYDNALALKEIIIQLTEDGATAQSVKYLEYLRDFAQNAYANGQALKPGGVDVWISNNGKTSAVEADDFTVDGSDFTVGGIKWNGSAWDYSEAGQQGGGGGGSSLPSVTSDDEGKVLAVNASGEWAAEPKVIYFHLGDDDALDITYADIKSAFGKKIPLYMVSEGEDGSEIVAKVVAVGYFNDINTVTVFFYNGASIGNYVTESENGYPVVED